MTDARRLPVVVVLAIALVVVLVLGDPAPTRFVAARDEGRAPAAVLAPAGVRSAAWYCAFATADHAPHAEDAAIITNLGAGPATVAVSAMRAGRISSERRVDLAGHATVSLQAGDIGAAAGAGILIEPFGSGVVVDHRASDAAGSTSQAPCATRPSSDWYFPAGSTRRGSIERLALFNPFTQAAVVDVTAYEPGGATRPSSMQGLSVAPRSRVVINVNTAADQRNALAVSVHAERGTRLVAELALEQRDAAGNGGFSIALGSPALGRDWHVSADPRLNATSTVAVLNPSANDVSVSVQTIVAATGRTTERPYKIAAGTVQVVNVPVPVGRGELDVEVATSSPSVAVAGFVSYTATPTRRRRRAPVTAGPIAIVTGATLDAKRSAFATPGPGATRNVTVMIENSSGAVAQVSLAVGSAGTVKATVARDSLTALTLGVNAENSPLVLSANTPVYAFRRIDEGTGVSITPALPGS